jgi:hypothetical protein
VILLVINQVLEKTLQSMRVIVFDDRVFLLVMKSGVAVSSHDCVCNACFALLPFFCIVKSWRDMLGETQVQELLCSGSHTVKVPRNSALFQSREQHNMQHGEAMPDGHRWPRCVPRSLDVAGKNGPCQNESRPYCLEPGQLRLFEGSVLFHVMPASMKMHEMRCIDVGM